MPSDDHIGVCSADILAIGEAPGRTENDRGVPFQGEAGKLLDNELLIPSGLKRNQLYLTNVIPWQPIANDFSSIPPHLVAKGERIVQEKVNRFNGKVIVPMGNSALSCFNLLPRSVMKWRGSVFPIGADGSQFMLPTIHPAAALRQHILVKTMRYDWARAASIVSQGWSTPEIELIGTTHNDARLLGLLNAKVLAVDIETEIGTCNIICISFCDNDRVAYSIDCRYGIPGIVRELLSSPIPKIMQGGWFDSFVLQSNGIEVANYIWDTAAMFHALDNNVGPQTSGSEGKSIIKPYSLAYMASIFTPFQYWKESAKDEGTGENYGAYKSNWKRFQEYNAMDALGTFWIARELKRRLEAAGRLPFYHEQYGRLLAPLVDLSLHGVRFDLRGASSHADNLRVRLEVLRGEITSLAGRPLHPVKVFKREPKVKENRPDKLRIRQRPDGSYVGEKGSLSNVQLHKYLYGELKLPKQLKDKKVTADEVAIRKLLLFVKENLKWRNDALRESRNGQAVSSNVQSISRRSRKSEAVLLETPGETLRVSTKATSKEQGADRRMSDLLRDKEAVSGSRSRDGEVPGADLQSLQCDTRRDSGFDSHSDRNDSILVERGLNKVDAARKVLEAILAFRETEKTIQFLGAGAVDADGRIRASYSPLVQTLRLRSYSNPRGTGFNLQNVQRNIRHFFIPDHDDDFFLELDYKQAEDLVVKTISAAVTGDARPLSLVHAVQTGSADIHRRLAATVFGCKEADVDYAMRYATKRCRHGKNNGMKYKRMQETLLKDGFVYTTAEIRTIMDTIDEAEPWVPEFHKAIRGAIWHHGVIYNSWGLALDCRDEFRANSLDDNSVYNRCYAFIEQSEVGILMKQYGLLTYYNEIRPRFNARLNMLVHDNVVLSVPRSELFEVASILKTALETERTYGVRVNSGDGGCHLLPLAIPVDIKVSRKLSCTCDDCAKTKAFEYSGPLIRLTWEKEFDKWLAQTDLSQQSAASTPAPPAMLSATN